MFFGGVGSTTNVNVYVKALKNHMCCDYVSFWGSPVVVLEPILRAESTMNVELEFVVRTSVCTQLIPEKTRPAR